MLQKDDWPKLYTEGDANRRAGWQICGVGPQIHELETFVAQRETQKCIQ